MPRLLWGSRGDRGPCAPTGWVQRDGQSGPAPMQLWGPARPAGTRRRGGRSLPVQGWGDHPVLGYGVLGQEQGEQRAWR